MLIIGLGTDIIEIDRIGRMLGDHAEQFTTRVFTESEQAYCEKHKSRTQHYAGRWAAKEAVLKALGTGMIAGLCWQEIEVFHEVGGKPAVRMTGGVLRAASERGIDRMLLTMSHCKTYATATAIAIADRLPDESTGPSA